MTQVFFDVSDIVTYIGEHRSISGIQRAAVRIIAQTVRMRGAEVFLAFHHAGKGEYLCCPAADLIPALEAFDTAALAAAFGVRRRPVPVPASYLERYRGQPVKQAVHVARMRWAGWRGRSRYFDRRGLDFDGWQKLYGSRTDARPLIFRPLRDVARPGDALCGLGAIWGRGKVLSAFRRASEAGVRVYLLVHDLIPMKLPAMADPRAARSYHQWLVGSAGYVTGYLANSEATARDLRAFLHDQGLEGRVHVTPLAQAGLGETGDPTPALSPAVHEAATLPYVLCVGTIEPRKNLWRLAQAWMRLAQRRDIDLPRLVLAGKRGWLTDGFLSVLERSGGFGGWVIWLEAPTDHELDHLYRHCLFTATVSLYEGWGLPIGEGLSYGKTGVVSEAASMPEVGGDLVRYCDPASLQSIEAAVLELLDPERRSALESRIAAAPLRGWEDVGRDVMAVLDPYHP